MLKLNLVHWGKAFDFCSLASQFRKALFPLEHGHLPQLPIAMPDLVLLVILFDPLPDHIQILLGRPWQNIKTEKMQNTTKQILIRP